MVNYLEQLESEAIYILREVAAQFKKPVLLFSGGKDSIVLSRLCEKAFRPGAFPFPLLMIDTGHNFAETLDYIQLRMAQLNEKLIIASVQQSIDAGRAQEETGPEASRNRLQSITLMDAINGHGFDAVIGGARRDEEKARAKERIFSLRDSLGSWHPEAQRAELWNIYNGRLAAATSEHMRVFPLSNWTELDIWQYIQRENLSVPGLYFAHRRLCLRRQNMLLAYSEFVPRQATDEQVELLVRFRTLGDMTCTAAFESTASTFAEVIAEIKVSQRTERGSRLDDKRSDAAMEERKKEGYF